MISYSFLSRRSLYCPFEEEKFQVSNYIRELRTLEAPEFLSAADVWKRFLTDAAQASGFTTLPSTGRALREATGLTLRELQENPEQGRIRAAELGKHIGPEAATTLSSVPPLFVPRGHDAANEILEAAEETRQS